MAAMNLIRSLPLQLSRIRILLPTNQLRLYCNGSAIQQFQSKLDVSGYSCLRSTNKGFASRVRTTDSKKSKSPLPFEIESSYPEDILVFSCDKQRFFRLFGIFGTVLLVFWGNLAMFIYNTVPLLNQQRKRDDNSWLGMIANFQAKYNSVAAAICLSLG